MNVRRSPLGLAVPLGVVLMPLLLGCTTPLPEPDSAAARLYASRCGGCHRLYAPGSMKPEMWKVQVDRMQGEMLRRGIAPLTATERDTLLEYLRRHSA
jgi:hypothetical protein